MKKFFGFLLAAVVAGSVLTGCSSTPTETMFSADVADSQSVITKLEAADEIKLKKAAISFGDKWDVTVDGETVAKIEGRPFYLIGDTYAMYSPAGNFVGAESEKLRLLNHKSDIYDYNGTQTGAISQQFMSLLYTFNLTDVDGKQIGQMKQKFSVGLKGEINNVSGEKVWSFKKELLSFGASITLKRDAQSDVPAMTAVWMTVIANEISEAANNDSGSSKSK